MSPELVLFGIGCFIAWGAAYPGLSAKPRNTMLAVAAIHFAPALIKLWSLVLLGGSNG